MTIQILIFSVSLFLMPFIGFDTEEAISNEIIQSNVCEDRLDINGLFIQGCLPNNGITCTTIGPDGTISFGLSPWDPTKLD